MTDLINKPPHYLAGGIETIDYLKAKSTPEEFKGYLRLTALAYLSRAPFKGQELSDIQKTIWYVARYEQEMTEQNDSAKTEPGKAV